MTFKYGALSKIFFVVILMAVSANSFAQSMTDSQVIQFVQQEQQKGSDQKTIVTKLFQKGVTAEQLRRIRKKYEAQKIQMGAVDLQEQDVNPNNTEGRMRSNKEKALEKLNQKNGYMIRSQREELDEKHKSRIDRQNDLNDEIGFMDIDSLVYYQNYFRDENQVFGRNIFNNKFLTFEPNQNMATPANYCLGAGDKVVIDVWGASQQTFEGTISPDGVIVIDGVGPIKLAGLSVKQATQTVKSRLGQYYSDCSFSLSVGDTRSIQVQVVGDVVMPGTYTLSSLSSAFNALYAAGGINEIGTLRDIKVYRGGRQVATIDVYDYLLNGNQKGDIRLQDNDIIQVGPYECLVNVRGKVKRPMFYEMKRSESVKQLLSYAGGFSGDAYTKNVRLSRKLGQEYSMHTIDEFQMGNFNVMDGDSLYVDSVMARYSNMVEIRGAVKHAGQFQLGGEIQTVRGLLEVAEGLREDAFRNRAVMHREKDDLTLEMISVDIDGILNGTVADIPLKKGDVLFVPSKVDMKGEQVLKISGEVIYPGTYQYADNTTIEDLILQAGGLTEAASMAKVDVFRRINDVNSTENTGKMADYFSFAIEDGFRINENGFKLQPFDEVVVRRSPSYSEQKNVSITGCVNFEGQYSMTSKNFRLSDLVKAAGGVTSLAYTKGARLNRVMTPDERMQRESSLRAAQIQLYEESLSSEKEFNKAQADTLLQMKMDLGTTYPVAVNLEKAMANPGCSEDIVLREGDQVEIPQFSNTVKVSGEVSYPISMNYKKGESLYYYIKRAGGYGNRAKKDGVYAIYMNGAVQKISKHSGKAIEPGCEIVVPSKKQGRKMSSGEIVAITSGAASISSVIVALISLIRK
ncbi:MAG: SLBB domain-containing protein [Bacteroidaceae bacterium]|nr:SLBB domain-containing protein [Bacteroidaceae bacterium]